MPPRLVQVESRVTPLRFVFSRGGSQRVGCIDPDAGISPCAKEWGKHAFQAYFDRQIYPLEHALLAKKVVTPPLKTIKPMWIELLCFHMAEIGIIWTRDCSPTKSDTTLGRHSMQGQVGLSSSETTV